MNLGNLKKILNELELNPGENSDGIGNLEYNMTQKIVKYLKSNLIENFQIRDVKAEKSAIKFIEAAKLDNIKLKEFNIALNQMIMVAMGNDFKNFNISDIFKLGNDLALTISRKK